MQVRVNRNAVLAVAMTAPALERRAFKCGATTYIVESFNDYYGTVNIRVFDGNGNFLSITGAPPNSSGKVRNKVILLRDELLGRAMKKVRNLMSGVEVEIPADTPLCCDPSSETYWSM